MTDLADDRARALGFRDADEFLDVATCDQLDVYDAIFGPESRRSLSRDEARLLDAWKSRDYEALEPHLVPGDTEAPLRTRRLTSDATRLLLDAWDVIDQARGR